MPRPTRDRIARQASRGHTLSTTEWPAAIKDLTYDAFVSCLSTTQQAVPEACEGAWACFLKYLADNGGADQCTDKKAKMPYQYLDSNDTWQTGYQTARSLKSIVGSILLHNPDYTNQRCLRNFCNEVADLLAVQEDMSFWGTRHSVPSKFKKWAFPSGMYCEDIPDAGKAAIKVAARLAIKDASETHISLDTRTHAPLMQYAEF